MQFIQAVQHTAKLGLITQVAGQDGYGIFISFVGRCYAHARQPIGPTVIQAAPNFNAVFSRFFKSDFFYAVFSDRGSIIPLLA